MVTSCSAYGCTERHKKGCNVSFYTFPKDPEIKKKWLIAIRRQNFTPTPSSRICSKHFKEQDFVLNRFTNKVVLLKEAVPSVFNFPQHLQKKLHTRREIKRLNTNTVASEVTDDSIKMEPMPSTSNSGLPIQNSKKIIRNKRKVYFGDFCEKDLEDPKKAIMVWKLSKKIIQKKQFTIKRLRNKNHGIEKKIKALNGLIVHLRKTTNISGSCFSILQIQMNVSETDDSGSIYISNIKDNETFTYSLILLNGFISTNSPTTTLLLVETAKQTWETNVKNNHFKCLVKLNLGRNDIVIKHGCSSKSLTVYYVQRKTNFSVLPLYIVCNGHDGKFQAPESENNDTQSACKRITVASHLIQSIIAEKLHEKNMGRKTFQLESECVVFNSALDYLEARKFKSKDLWIYFAREIMTSHLGNKNRKYMAFLSCTKYDGSRFSEDLVTYDDFVGLTDGYVALGGGGLALYGTACLYTWPEHFKEVFSRFNNETPVDRYKFMDDSSYRGTLGGCFSTTLGSVLHELCHTFELGHTKHGIMGRDFGNIYKIFTNSHKVFDQIQNKCNIKPKVHKFGDKQLQLNHKTSDVDWTESCAVLLSYHRWFNDNTSKSHIFKYDFRSKFIKSTSGIRVVEIRDVQNDELIVAFWTFTQKVLKYTFCIPDEIFNVETNKILVAEDSVGNIIKEPLL